jgi:argininosuccinate lyase
LVAGAELNRPAIAERLDRGHLDATTFMEYLITRGTPQRTAHELVGKLVRLGLDRGVRLSDLPLADYQAADASLTDDVYRVLGAQQAVAAFRSYGSTAPAQVDEQIKTWQTRLNETRTP